MISQLQIYICFIKVQDKCIKFYETQQIQIEVRMGSVFVSPYLKMKVYGCKANNEIFIS
jgi:hypothetical protein